MSQNKLLPHSVGGGVRPVLKHMPTSPNHQGKICLVSYTPVNRLGLHPESPFCGIAGGGAKHKDLQEASQQQANGPSHLEPI